MCVCVTVSQLCTVGDVVVSPVSPREGGFGRGAGPHVDQFVLREKEERRKREMENRVGGEGGRGREGRG